MPALCPASHSGRLRRRAGAVPPSHPSGAAPARPRSSQRGSSDGVRAWSAGSAGWPEAAAPAAANRAPQLPAEAAAQKAQQQLQQPAVPQQLLAGGHRGLQVPAGQPLQPAAALGGVGQLPRQEAAAQRQAVRGQQAGREAAGTQLSGLPEPRAAADQQKQQPGHVAGAAAGRPSVHLAEGQVSASGAAGGHFPLQVGAGQQVQQPAGRKAAARRDSEPAAAASPMQVPADASSATVVLTREEIQAQQEDQVCGLPCSTAVSVAAAVLFPQGCPTLLWCVHALRPWPASWQHNHKDRWVSSAAFAASMLPKTFHQATVMFLCLAACQKLCSGCTSRQMQVRIVQAGMGLKVHIHLFLY